MKQDNDLANCAEEFDIAANQFRNGVFKLLDEAQTITVFRELTPAQQIESFVAGILAGVVATCFGCTTDKSPGSREHIMEYLDECLESARGVVEDAEIEIAERKKSETK